MQKAVRWRGPIGASMIAHFAGSQSTTLEALADPRGWAMQILGFELTAKSPGKREVTKAFRARMRDVHPDHGGAELDAAKAMSDLSEARRILSAKP